MDTERISQTVALTDEKVRDLSASDLGVEVESLQTDQVRADVRSVRDEVEALIEDGYSGVIFTGPPGTSKSWYAAEVAKLIAGDESRLYFVQFHPSYQYEDFIEGLVPLPDGGFDWQDKHLLLISTKAREAPDHRFVLVIDEISRAEPARVFGEALTYIETTRRGQSFLLASGRPAMIPPNVLVLATMNLFDRGVEEVDAAFERRFAKIAMNPDPGILEQLLSANGVDEELQRRIQRFFIRVQRTDNPLAQLGHAYFRTARDVPSLERLWDYQLSHFFDRAYRFDREKVLEVKRWWDRIFEDLYADDGQPTRGEIGEPPPGET